MVYLSIIKAAQKPCSQNHFLKNQRKIIIFAGGIQRIAILYQFYLLIAYVGFVIPAKAGIQFLLFDIMCNSFGNF